MVDRQLIAVMEKPGKAVGIVFASVFAVFTVTAASPRRPDVRAVDDAAKTGASMMNPGSKLPCVTYERGGDFRVLVYGNSIAVHPPKPEFGWTNDWGMAAGSRDRDFAHLVVAGLEAKFGVRADFRVRSIALLERNIATNLSTVAEIAEDAAWTPDYFVLAVGENVASLGKDDVPVYTRFLADITRMVSGTGGKTKALLRSPFWGNAVKSRCTAQAAAETGAVFVDTGDLAAATENKATGLFRHRGVANHPGDLGMLRLAEMTLAGFGASGYPRSNVRVDGAVSVTGLYSTGNKPDSTVFDCRRKDDRISFRFLVDDKTPCAAAERGLPERTLECYDRVEVFLSPAWDMSRPYCCIEIGLEGDVLDYRAVYYRKNDYAFGLKTLKVRTGSAGGRHEVGFSLSVQELEELGIDPEDFHMGVFRADFAPGGRLVDWYSAMPQGYGEPDFHRPCHLFHASIGGTE